jgi:2-succinyl-6-hydroxy-2,4-cyclohexadiene-1-carboxylate synthase
VPESLVLLHGFSGTRHAWDGVIACLPPERYLARALDLPGHGENADLSRYPAPAVPVVGGPWGKPAPPTPSIPGHGDAAGARGVGGEGVEAITFANCVAHVLARAPARFTLVGYSLGGRIALHIALAAPERVRRLVLVSTTAGIEDTSARAGRSASDHRLADELERIPFEDFIERWRTQPLFADDPPEVGALAREDQRRNRPDALAAVLRGVGTGEMTPLWDRLGELTMPVAVVVGDRDAKFQALGRRMVELLPVAKLVIVPGGHGLPLENPDAVAQALQRIDP